MPQTESINLSHHPYKWLIIITVMLAACMEVLDSTIVNISLPHLISALQTTPEKITWVLTTYIIAAAIFIPLTGFLENCLGIKKLLCFNIIGFMLGSFACGLSSNLLFMVISRFFQGAFGASLIPLSQVIIKQSFSEKEQSKAMAIWGLGIMAAPTLGPTLGGIITEYLNWRWIFYVNLPLCFSSFFLVLWLLPQQKSSNTYPSDWIGFIFIALGLGGFQFFIDQGSSKAWFQSPLLLAVFACSVLAIASFVIRSLLWPKQRFIIHLPLFKEKNFTLSTLLLAIYRSLFMSILAIQPLMLEQLFHYSILQTSYLMMPRALATAMTMGIFPKLSKCLSVRWILALGLLIFSYANYYMTGYNLNSNAVSLIYASIYYGISVGLVMPTLSVVALKNISTDKTTEAAGLFGYGRFLGASFGIAIFSTLMNQRAQLHWHSLVASITLGSPNLNFYANLKNVLPTHLLYSLHNQSQMLAYLDIYRLDALLSLAMLGLLPWIKNQKKKKPSINSK